jgi:hypothetical protein
LLRRCTRVFFSSLRCFFLAIRLRRVLMTEPITYLANVIDTRYKNLSDLAELNDLDVTSGHARVTGWQLTARRGTG